MRCALATLAMLCLLAIVPAGALAHGDESESSPAPDALAAGPVSFPYAGVSAGVARRLDRVVEAADARGLHLKVALIARREDLGDLLDFWGRPDEYAAFLARQLPGYGDALTRRPPLLVVMPSGLGFADWPAAGRRAARGLPLSVDADQDAIARAAAQVIQRTMAATGRPVPRQFGDDFGRGPRVAPGVALGLVAALALGAAGVADGLRLRRRRRVAA